MLGFFIGLAIRQLVAGALPSLLTESGGHVLLEDGGRLVLE